MPRFTLYWRWAGREGVAEDVEVTWSLRGYALIGRASAGEWRATVRTVLPFSIADGGGVGWPPVGEGRIECEGELVLEGPMEVAYSAPTVEGQTPVELVIGDAQVEERGLFPPAGPPPPVRRPGDVVDGRWVTDDTRRRLRGGTGPVELGWEQIIRADSDVFSNIPEVSDGQGFPYVIGAPGTARKPGSPAWWVDEGTGSDKLVVDGYGGMPASGKVAIWGPTFANPDGRKMAVAEDVPLYTTTSDTGQTITYVLTSDITGLYAPNDPPIYLRADLRYFASWLYGAPRPGGAGTVLLSILAQSSRRWDADAWGAVRGALDRTFTLAGYFDSREPALALIEGTILPLLPLAIVSGPRGLRPMMAPWWQGDLAARLAEPLIDGEGIAYDGGLVRPRHVPRVASMTLGYAYRPDTGRTSNVARVDASSTPYPLSMGLPAEALTGVEDLETRLVWDRDTATAMIAARLREQAVAPRVIHFDVTDLDRYGPGAGTRALMPGKRVRLTSERFGLADQPAVVTEVEVSAVGMRIAVDLRGDLVRADLAQKT